MAAICALLGLGLGSFINALVWRLHEQSKSQSTKDADLSILRGRSMCPDCRHVLGSLDLVPIFSWLFLKGQCRYCSKIISWQYPFVELSASVLFVLSYIFWPYNFSGWIGIIVFGLWLVVVTISLALALYDLKWMLLPNRLIYPLSLIVVVFGLLLAHLQGNQVSLVNFAIGSLAYGGIFYILYQVSRGKWIGGGDVRLGFVIGAILGWQKSILSLTLAAYLGTLVIGILYFAGRYHRKMKLPFGPFLLASMFITMLWGQQLIDWYLRISGL